MAIVVDDFVPGDPAQLVLGKPDEQPARKHGKMPPKPNPTAATIHADIRYRMAELEGVLEEVSRLERALKALEGV